MIWYDDQGRPYIVQMKPRSMGMTTLFEEGANMNPLWKDYHDKSELPLVFGHVSAEVMLLGPVPDSPLFRWGVVTHPYTASTVEGTLEQAKLYAEAQLKLIINPAFNLLNSNIS